MIFKRYEWGLLLRVVLLFSVLCGTAWVFIKGLYTYEFFLVAGVIILLIDLYRFNKRTHTEMEQFVESVRYRDFSRHYNVLQSPGDLLPIREGFNEINSTFRTISKERETQQQYLQNILELVDTGILSYDMESTEVLWMNEPLKRILQLPYLKSINSLTKRHKALADTLLELRPGEQSIVTVQLERKTLKLLLSATIFSTGGKKYKLTAFQNVNEAIEETESKAWQKLLSVMTHEIMNSVAPISSLAETLKHRIEAAASQLNNDKDTVDDIKLGIDTIKKRSEGLLKFAETYRYLNKISKPHLSKIFVRELFETLHRLMQPTLAQKGIELEIILPEPSLTLDIDTSLLEQVLINLVLNAIEAVKDREEPRIVLSAYSTNQKVTLKVADNGYGMDEEVMDNIFVPFFTTKKNGSGIGLSLCKQIMVLHKGSIQVQSRIGEGTAFLLEF